MDPGAHKAYLQTIERNQNIMLKKAVLTLAVVGVTVVTYGQGQVNFNNRILGTSAQVYSAPGVLAAGTAFYAQLFAADGVGQSEGSLVGVGTPVNFRTSAGAGYVQEVGTTTFDGTAVNTTVNVTAVNGGAVTLQLRAWSSAFSSYAAAVAGGGAYGKSALLNLASTGNPNATPTPGLPVNLDGLTGFTMVPEPSTMALGVLGVGSLLFLRRRK